MKNLIIELHTLMPYAINAANAGQFGEIKNVNIGGVSRVVMSSQSLKYAIRQAIAKNNLRTNYYLGEIAEKCFEIDPTLRTDEFAEYIMESCDVKMKADKKKKGDPDALAQNALAQIATKSSTTEVTSYAEISDIAQTLVDAWHNKLPKDKTKEKLQSMERMVDLWTAAFGRMSTNALFSKIESAVATSMSYSVDENRHQSDYFSVVESLKMKYEPTNDGAANLQDTSISANLMYRYMNLSVETLARNYKLFDRMETSDVMTDPIAVEFANFIAELMVHFCYTHPVAKQHSMASMPTPAMVAVFTGKNIFPCTMDNAFNKVVQANYDKSVAEKAVDRVIQWANDDMLADQYDTAVIWTNHAVCITDSMDVRPSVNKARVYIKNDIVAQVLAYLAEWKATL